MSRESVDEYLARGGQVQRGEYVEQYGNNVKRTPMGPRATASGRKAMLDKGCPRCGGELTEAEVDGLSAVTCDRCGEAWRAATGEDLPSRADQNPHERFDGRSTDD